MTSTSRAESCGLKKEKEKGGEENKGQSICMSIRDAYRCAKSFFLPSPIYCTGVYLRKCASVVWRGGAGVSYCSHPHPCLEKGWH